MAVGALLVTLALAGEPPGPDSPVTARITAAAEGLAPAEQVQASDTIQELRLADRSMVRGRILSETDERVVIETVGGIRMELERAQIRSMRPARGQVVNGEFWRADPNRTRLFFAPTARAMDRGEGYVASYMLFFPFVGYGLSDRFTVAGGTPIFPDLIGRVLYVAPKMTLVSQPRVDLAAGAIALFATEALDEGSVGILYGNGTFGGADRSVTVGAGWGFSLGGRTLGGRSSNISDDPVFLLGGDLRVGERTKLLTENWFVLSGGDSGGVLTGGIRFFGERLSADLGVGLAVGDGSAACCLPLVNFVYTFGHGR